MEYTNISKITYNLNGGKIKEGSVFEEFVSEGLNITNINEDTVIPLPQFFEVENETQCLVGWVIDNTKNNEKVHTVEVYGSDLDSELPNLKIGNEITSVTLNAIYTTTQNSFTLDKSNTTIVEKYQTNRKLTDEKGDGKYYFGNSDIKLTLPTEVVFLAVEKDKEITQKGTISLLDGRTLSELSLDEKLKGVYNAETQIVMYKRNNNVLLPSDIINHNDFIIASIKNKSETKLSVLPCVYKGIDDIDVVDNSGVAAVNYGTTYVFSKKTKTFVFNSDKVNGTTNLNYYLSNTGENCILYAAPKTNCIFVGWYKRKVSINKEDSSTKITYIPLGNNQQIEILVLPGILSQYAAVFATHDTVNINKEKTEITFPEK